MKTFFFSLFLATNALAILVTCSGKKAKTAIDKQDEVTTRDDHATDLNLEDIVKPEFDVEHIFQEQLADFFKSYVELKDAFVTSNSGSVKDKVESSHQTLAKVDMKLLSGAAHSDWMTYHTSMQKALDEIQAGSDIEIQRKSFRKLSDNLYKSIKAFGLAGEDAYYEYCPMAFDNEGAYWLSSEDKIRNPYFGNKMLSCGEVVEKLQ